MNNWIWVLLATPISLLAVFLIISVPLQANRRGQGFFAWFLLGIVSFNPVYTLILVALLPNKARSRLREQFASELDAKLARVHGQPVVRSGKSSIDHALGNLPTTDYRDRSIGHIETQSLPDPKPG